MHFNGELSRNVEMAASSTSEITRALRGKVARANALENCRQLLPFPDRELQL